MPGPVLSAAGMSGEALPAHVQAMLRPGIYPHATQNIRLIQTHISWVILTGAFAYKIKKPQHFDFLDFSSLASRRHFCLLELELNRRLAPSLYLEVLAICPDTKGKGFQLQSLADTAGAESAIDYCLKMRQFPEQALMLDHLKQGSLEPAAMDELAERIAAFHRQARIVSEGEAGAAGSSGMLARHLDDNIAAGRAIQGLHALLDDLEAATHATMARLAARVDARRLQGFVRDCHGDLHLRNIAMIDGHPVPFDCIEFNADYRLIDVMNDVAFLFMDCDAMQRPDLGFRFMSRYLEESGDYEGLMLLNLYASYRASVRGKVASLLARDAGVEESERQSQLAQAERYYRLALSYCHAGKPRLIAIGGLSGSGKSHLARLGCGPMRALMIRSDATRKRLAQSEQLELYSEAMSRRTYEAMLAAAQATLEAGYSVILDATFLDPAWRRRVFMLADTCQAPLDFLWLELPPDVLRRRILARSQSGHDISDADLAVLDAQLEHYRRPEEPGIRVLHQSDRWPHLGQQCFNE